MEDIPPVLPPEPNALPAPPAPTMSLGARLMNVFAIPGDVFTEVRHSLPRMSNWLVPALLTTAAMMLMVWVLASQPAIQQKERERVEQRLEKLVAAGKLTRAEADKQEAIIEKFSGPAVRAVSGVVAGGAYGFGRVFWWATVLWLLGRWFLKTRFPYLKAMEVAGLAGMIGILGLIVTLLLQVNFSNPDSSPSLALLLKDYDAQNAGHLALATFNVFHIWQAIVLAVALSRLSGVPFLRGAFTFFGFWLLLQFGMLIVMAQLKSLFG